MSSSGPYGAGNEKNLSLVAGGVTYYVLLALFPGLAALHGLPPRLLQPRFGPGRYLALLGRLSPEKGADVAIRVARAVNMPLHIAAKIPRGEIRYFKESIEPMVDGSRVRLVGEVNGQAKQDFLASAAALLFPINWPEPFGLVMIEAMASGTPVNRFSPRIGPGNH